MGKCNGINSIEDLNKLMATPNHPVIGTSNFTFFEYKENMAYLVGAGTGVGKSWITCMEIAHLLQQGKNVFLIHTEMTTKDYFERLLKCPGLLTEKQRIALIDHFDSISVGGFNEKGEVPFPDLYSAINFVKDSSKLDVIFIDYINNYYTPSNNKYTSGYQLTQNFTRYLDKCRSNKNTHAAYFCLSQAIQVDKKQNQWEFNGDHQLLQTFDLAIIFTHYTGNKYIADIRKSRFEILDTNTYQINYNKQTNCFEEVRPIYNGYTSDSDDVNVYKEE